MQNLTACLKCGQIHDTDSQSHNQVLACSRCGAILHPASARRQQLAAVLAVCALVFYLPAVTLPMLRVERLGHVHEDSLLGGLSSLFQQGHWPIALLIFLFSVILPPAKLLAIGLLCTQSIANQKHKALIYHSVEMLGRWSMLDVLLVAVMIAFVKLSDLLAITPGHGLMAFTSMVLLSLSAGFCYSPAAIWQPDNIGQADNANDNTDNAQYEV